MTTQENILTMLKIHIQDESITENDSLSGVLGMDSLDRIDFIVQVEIEYHIDFSEDEIDRIKTCKDIAEIVDSKLNTNDE